MARDSFGRNVGDLTSGSLLKSLTGAVSVTQRFGGNKDEMFLELQEAVEAVAEKIDKTSKDELEAAKKWVNQVTAFGKQLTQKKSSISGGASKDTVLLAKIADSTTRLWQASQKQHTIWVGLCKLTATAQRQIADAIRMAFHTAGPTNIQIPTPNLNFNPSQQANQAANQALGQNMAGGTGGGGPGGAGSGSGGAGGKGGGMSGGAATLALATTVAHALTESMEAFHHQMLAMMDLDPFKHIFSGGLKESNEFRENLRQIIHQTEGFGNANRQIEQSYRNITTAVTASGVRRGEFQQMWLKNLERGFQFETQDDKRWAKQFRIEDRARKMQEMKVRRSMSIQTSALSTAQQLGMETSAINDLFMDWHLQLGMSALEMADIGRHMQDVARNTGVTGSKLEQAVKSSDRIVRSLKSAGLASGGAVKNVIELTTLMEKYGVGEKGAELLSGLASRRGFFEATPEMRSMLTRIGAATGDPSMVNSVMSGGVLQSRQKTQAFRKGMENELTATLQQFSGDFKRLGVQLPQDLTQLSKMQQELMGKGPEGERLAGVIDQIVAARFGGMGVGDVEQMLKSLGEAGKTTGQRIQDISTQMAEMQKKGLQGTDEFKRLQKQLLETQTNMQKEGFNAVAGFSQKIKEAGGHLTDDVKTQIVNKLKDSMGEIEAKSFVNNLGKNADSFLKNLGERARAEGKDLTKLLSKRGFSLSQIQKDLKSGDERAMLVLNEAMAELQQAESAAQDPITDIRRQLTEVNNWLGDIYDRIGFGMGPVTAKILYFAGFLLSVLSELLVGITAFQTVASFFGGASNIGTAISGSLGPMLTGTGAGTIATSIGSTLGPILLSALGPLILAAGGIKGWFEAESAGRTKGEGALFGALTGGAGTGSMFSSMLGVEKGGALDKTLGVAGATAWGTAAGAAIGAGIGVWFGGVGAGPGALIGAAIGAIVGAATEIIKILTEGTTVIQKYVVDPLLMLGEIFWKPFENGYKTIVALFNGDIGGVIEGFVANVMLIPDILYRVITRLAQGLVEFIASVPGLVARTISAVFLELPKFIYTKITEGLTWLAGNEFVGPIFQPILDTWKEFMNVFNILYQPLSEMMSGFIQFGDEIKKIIMDTLGPLFDMGEGFSLIEAVLPGVKWLIKGLATVIGGLLYYGLMPLKTTLQGLAKVLEFVGGAVQTATGWVQSLYDGITSIFYYLYDVLVGHSIVPDLITAIIQWFATLPLKIPGYLAEAAKGLATKAWDAFTQGAGQLYDTLTSAITNVGTYLYEQFKEALSKLGEFVMNMGKEGVTKAASTVGSVAETGAFGMGGVVAAKAAKSKYNPWNWFDEGTREIQNTGVAVLHEGEMVVPKSIADELRASGNGAFPKTGSANPLSTGAFEKDASDEAMRGTMHGDMNKLMLGYDLLSQLSTAVLNPIRHLNDMVYSSLLGSGAQGEKKGASGMLGTGLFDYEQVRDAQSSVQQHAVNLSNLISSALTNKTQSDSEKRSVFADVSRALDYGTSGSDADLQARTAQISDRERLASEVSSNMLDYREQMRGEVSTLAVNRAGVESSIQRQQYGEQGASGSGIIPSLDAVAEYLTTTQLQKLTDIYEVLADIRNNTTGRSSSGSNVVGKQTGGVPSPTRPGVKRIARDATRGFWDLTFGDASPGAVTTEGRGGSA